MGGLASFVQALATFITGPFGISTIIVAVAATFLAAAVHMCPMNWGWRSLICGAMAFSAAWAVNTFIAVAV